MTNNSSTRDGRQSPFPQARIISNLQRRLRLAEEGWQYNHETLNMLLSSIRATDFTQQEAVTAFLGNVNQLFPYGMEDAETDTDVNDDEEEDDLSDDDYLNEDEESDDDSMPELLDENGRTVYDLTGERREGAPRVGIVFRNDGEYTPPTLDGHGYEAYDEDGVRHEVVPWIMNIAPPHAG